MVELYFRRLKRPDTRLQISSLEAYGPHSILRQVVDDGKI